MAPCDMLNHYLMFLVRVLPGPLLLGASMRGFHLLEHGNEFHVCSITSPWFMYHCLFFSSRFHVVHHVFLSAQTIGLVHLTLPLPFDKYNKLAPVSRLKNRAGSKLEEEIQFITPFFVELNVSLRSYFRLNILCFLR